MPYQNPLTLSVEDIRDIARYAHWIPITRGLQHKFISETFPGWEWHSLMSKFQGSRIMKRHEEHNEDFACQRLVMGLCLRADIVAVRLTRRGDRIFLKVVTAED
jgi:hypothetical protein